MKRTIITLIATLALTAPIFAQSWGDKIITKMKNDRSVDKNISVNRDPDTHAISSERYTFKFKSASTYQSLKKELMNHSEEAYIFSMEGDDTPRIALKMNHDGRDCIYELQRIEPGMFSLRISRQPEKQNGQRTEAARQRAEAAKQRAEAARQRGEAAKQRAEAARQRAEAAKARKEALRQNKEAMRNRKLSTNSSRNKNNGNSTVIINSNATSQSEIKRHNEAVKQAEQQRRRDLGL